MVNRVTAYCMQVGWSSAELARRLRIPAPVVSKWDSGEALPPAWVEQKVFLLTQAERRRQHQLLTRKRVQVGADPTRRWRPQP